MTTVYLALLDSFPGNIIPFRTDSARESLRESIGEKLPFGERGLLFICVYLAVRRRLKQRERELLVNNPHIEVYESTVWNVDTNALHWKPEEQFLLLQTCNSSQLPIAQITPNHSLKVDLILKLGKAGFLQINLQLTVLLQGI
eukprot:Gb_40129 [translate_table: standard]